MCCNLQWLKKVCHTKGIIDLLHKLSPCIHVLLRQDLWVAKLPFQGILDYLWQDNVCVQFIYHDYPGLDVWWRWRHFTENASKALQLFQMSMSSLLHEKIGNIFLAYIWTYISVLWMGFSCLVYQDMWCDKLCKQIIIVLHCILNIHMSTFCFGILDLWKASAMTCNSSNLNGTLENPEVLWGFDTFVKLYCYMNIWSRVNAREWKMRWMFLGKWMWFTVHANITIQVYLSISTLCTSNYNNLYLAV